ncbi:MAG: DUF393 domain-containing protein [Planctomycetes bacterium]|nr:DUF393 domain-containing protein [Planctomycetota bacterium]
MTEPADDFDIVFFDGECGMCHALVRFVMRRDSAAHFRFAPLRGETFRRVMAERATEVPDSLVLAEPSGAVTFKSTAVVKILARMPSPWRLASTILRVIPRPLRDVGYDAIARVRGRLFERPTGQCPIVPPDLAARFLP